MIVDSSICIVFERRHFDLERLLADHSPPAIAAATAAELLIGVERADTPERRARREAFVENILARVPIIPFDLAQAFSPFASPSWPSAEKSSVIVTCKSP